MNKVSVDKLVNSIMYDYDRNRNGSIDLRSDNRDESSFEDDKITHEGNQTIRTITSYSYDQLFISADKNKDNVVTKDELTDVVKQYDKDNDGKLTARSFWDTITGKPAGELDVFNREIPERSRVIFRQVIGVDPVVPNPPPFNPPNHAFLTSRA